MKIYCCECRENVYPRLTSGKKIYPHRPDLATVPYWQCRICSNYVGCHYKTKNPTRPLGNIASKKLREARQAIHFVIDPLWKSGSIARGDLYRLIANRLGIRAFHIGEITTIEEARAVHSLIVSIKGELHEGPEGLVHG